ncbi:TspO/MBR family protein [Domibacillus mangrovi]|uniref:TspO protein n=1 Tax=Domibacillus mangrovi TaxID=1714354 RepID=A0A1Q5P2A0_9BACI|nr:TspO/MBR family protein [Domibacillus mangrovi]OKL36318.1 TspO protein [Domibacillus mangrovi]
MELVKVNGAVNVKKLMVSVLVPVVGGSIIGAIANQRTREEYRELKKPSFSPPGWVFPIVWTGLYKAMGIAEYRASAKAKNQEEKKKALIPYEIQLGLNFLWSFLFFKWGLRGTAFIEMAVMFGIITWTTYEFYQIDPLAGHLMVPYIMWVTFALGLNYSIWKWNDD